MINFAQKILYQFKEYFILLFLVLICLLLISNSENSKAKKLKAFAIANFAVVEKLSSSFISLFVKDESIDELKKQNAILMLELEKVRKAEKENEELREMLSIKDTSSYNLIPTNIVSKLTNKFQGNFVIDKGSNDGIIKGMPVINTKGLAGIVMDVTENFSVVKTLYNTSLNIAVNIKRTNVNGILNFNGRNLIVKNIPTTYDVKEGDEVVTSDFSTAFPPSIPIGVIEKKELNMLGLLHTLYVKPFSDVNTSHFLFVIKVVPSKQINNLEMNLIKKP
ncbi:MAG: rod shape-determining protein MreC [Melioribacteraceae bacterium]|nr:rod shape-determining protein MreC [Melioribacteraceae bacterium]